MNWYDVLILNSKPFPLIKSKEFKVENAMCKVKIPFFLQALRNIFKKCIKRPNVQTLLKSSVLWMLLLFWLNMAQNITSVTTKLIAACLQLGLRTPILCRHWILPLCRVITIKEVTLLSHSHFPSLCHNRYYDRDNSDISQVILWRHGQRILLLFGSK